MKRIDGRIAAVTGAGSGIGRALAVALARRRCPLALADIDENGLAQTVEAATGLGVKVTAVRLDVADRAAMYSWADQVVADHGGVNLIFNNAGVALSTTIEGADYDDLDWIMDINFWGVVYGTKAFLPHLKAAGEGHVINISSVFGLFAQPGMSAYNASKFAVRGFTESLRQELDLEAGGVSATCVHPGGIRTAIARNSRISVSMAALTGIDGDTAKARFERLLATPPEKAAEVILTAVERNRRRVLIGPDACIVDAMQRLLPAAYQRLVVAAMRRQRAGGLRRQPD